MPKKPIVLVTLAEISEMCYLSFHTAAPSHEYYVQSHSQCRDESYILAGVKVR